MGGAETGSPSRAPVDPRFAVPALAVAMAAATAFALWLARDTTFTIDELVWFLTSPDLDLSQALEPHGGHLVLVTRLVYAGLLEAFGTGTEPFRILTVASLLLAVGLLFAYTAKRVGAAVALAPAAVLLFFGSDAFHVFLGNGFTILFAVSCGLGALLALDRRHPRADVLACLLLCVGVATYTIALAFVVAVAILVFVGDDRWPRAWIFLIPVALYAAWWLWASAKPDAYSEVDLANLLTYPAWIAQALAAVLGALSGLDYDFTGQGRNDPTFGPVLALLGLAALVWRLRLGRVAPGLWALLGLVLTLWLMQDLVADPEHTPYSSRYLLPGAVAVVLVGAEAARGWRPGRTGLIALYGFAAIGVGTNAAILRDVGAELRNEDAPVVRAAFAGLGLAGDAADPTFNPADHATPGSPLEQAGVLLPLDAVATRFGPPTGAYLEAADRYGPLGYPAERIASLTPELREIADAFLIGALGIRMEATDVPQSRAGCRVARPRPGEAITARLPSRGAVLSATAASGSVSLWRFSSEPGISVGTLTPGQAAALELPADRAAAPWTVSMPGASLSICPLG